MLTATATPKLELSALLRAQTTAGVALAPSPIDRFSGPIAGPLGLPRRSASADVEPVAPSAWGRAWQMVRSWFQPAATAAMLGAGLVPTAMGMLGASAETLPPAGPAMAPADATRVASTASAPPPQTPGSREAEALAADVLFGQPTTAPLTRTADVTPSLAQLGLLPAATWVAAAQPNLSRGSHGPAVVRLQERLNALGYDAGTADGRFGRTTRTAVLEYQFDHREHVRTDGRVGPSTWRELAAAQARRAAPPTHTPGGLPIRPQYQPFRADTVRLFEEAADRVDLPRAWASSPALHRLLLRESQGEVGKLNYTYGHRSEREVLAELRAGIITARSSATGLGQLLLGNVSRYYPSGRAGIGDPVEEAAGMLRYIEARYGTPAAAWASYGRYHEGY